MGILILIFASFISGIITFLLPCTYPLIPGYLVVLSSNESRAETFRRIIAFILGFSVVAFVVLAAISTLVGQYRDIIFLIGGILIILFGIALIAGKGLPTFLNKNINISVPKVFRQDITVTKSFVLGAFLAFGWSPCIGPILASILLLATASETYILGAILLAVFLIGLSFPFFIIGYIYTQTKLVPQLSANFFRWVHFIGGITLILIGILMLRDDLGFFTATGYQLLSDLDFLVEIEYKLQEFFSSN